MNTKVTLFEYFGINWYPYVNLLCSDFVFLITIRTAALMVDMQVFFFSHVSEKISGMYIFCEMGKTFNCFT